MTEPRIVVQIDAAAEVWAHEAGEEVSDDMAEELADQLAERVRRELPDVELEMTRTVRMEPGSPNPVATVSRADDESPTPQQKDVMRSLERQISRWARELLRRQ